MLRRPKHSKNEVGAPKEGEINSFRNILFPDLVALFVHPITIC
jgi:hypothetical protein